MSESDDENSLHTNGGETNGGNESAGAGPGGDPVDLPGLPVGPPEPLPVDPFPEPPLMPDPEPPLSPSPVDPMESGDGEDGGPRPVDPPGGIGHPRG